MDRFHLKFIFLSKGWWKVDFKIQKAYSCVSAASAAGVECVHKVVPKLCGKVSVYQSQLRPCLAVAWPRLGCGLAGCVWKINTNDERGKRRGEDSPHISEKVSKNKTSREHNC